MLKSLLSFVTKKFKPLQENKNTTEILAQKITALENSQKELYQLLTEKSWTIEKVVIENMHTDKFEFNMDTIDVKDLSGMLSIGLNYGGKVLKVGSKVESKKEVDLKKNGGEEKSLHEKEAGLEQGAENTPGSRACRKGCTPKIKLNFK